jgi:membrane protease YdiL (CAAX protease family)
MHDANTSPISRPRVSPRVSPRAGLKVVSLALITLLIGVTSYFAFLSDRAGERSFWLLAGGPVVGLAPIALWRAWKDGELARSMRPRAGDFTLGSLGAAFLFLAAYAFSRLVTPNGSPRAIWLARLYLQLGDPSALRAHSSALVAALICVAAAEEIVWRGLATSLLAELIGSRWGWVGSAGLYALAYVPTMWALAAPSGPNPILPLAALGAGLVWGGMARRVDRLIPGIVSHALFDWCVVVIFRLWGESL